MNQSQLEARKDQSNKSIKSNCSFDDTAIVDNVKFKKNKQFIIGFLKIKYYNKLCLIGLFILNFKVSYKEQ